MAILCRSDFAESAVLGVAAGLPAPQPRQSQEKLIFTAPAHRRGQGMFRWQR
jgi:hypothetical protein